MDGKVATIGISEYAQKALGDVVYVEVPEVGSLLKRKGIIFLLPYMNALVILTIAFHFFIFDF